jgi:hypothetical protein
MARLPEGGVGVCDTADHSIGALTFSTAQWAAFLSSAKEGVYDLRPAPTA